MNDSSTQSGSTSLLDQLHAQSKTLGAVILAGGLARRMDGQDKGLVPVAGRSMTEWVLAAISPQVDSVVINANRNRAKYSSLGVPVIPDEHSGHLGPLAGLSSAMNALDTDYVFMCPCDSPFVSGTLVQRLGFGALSQDLDVAVTHDGQREQPVFCVVHRRCRDSLLVFLNSGERKIDKWYATQRKAAIDCSDLGDSFRNINTFEELAAAEEMLEARPHDER